MNRVEVKALYCIVCLTPLSKLQYVTVVTGDGYVLSKKKKKKMLMLAVMMMMMEGEWHVIGRNVWGRGSEKLWLHHSRFGLAPCRNGGQKQPGLPRHSSRPLMLDQLLVVGTRCLLIIIAYLHTNYLSLLSPLL